MPGKTGDHPVTRFLRFIEPSDFRSGGCWNWTGCLQENGYGRFNIGGCPLGAHVAAYKLFHGAIPDGLDVCHSCDNRKCVRPDHLFTGTRLANMQDAAKKGRISRGEKHAAAIRSGIRIPAAKLSPLQVLAIDARLRSGHRPSQIAEDYDVTAHTIIAIQRGRTWSHITNRGQNNGR